MSDSSPVSAAPSNDAPSVREPLVVFTIAMAGVAALWLIGMVVPWVDRNLQALVAVVFLYLPTTIAWRAGKDLSAFGFTLQPIRRSVAFGLIVPAVLFPLFLLAFYVFYDVTCAPHQTRLLASLAPPGICRRFLGWRAVLHPRLPDGFLESALAQLVVTAVPEELFFRGYLLERLERIFPPRHRVLGGGIGWALVLSSALFALGHVVVIHDPRRLAVFFPGLLFGWMRSATGSIAAGAVAHAASNLYIDVLHRTFFR